MKEEGVWQTVRLWDNADDVHEHHVHEYTRVEGKQEPVIREFNSINESNGCGYFRSPQESQGDREAMAEIVSSIREEAATRRFDVLMTSPELDTYPSPMHLIAADNPRFDEMATRALLDGDAVLLVYDDGRELLICPEPTGGARIETRHPSVHPVAA